MRAARSLLLVALLPLFTGCQMFADKPTNSTAGMTRMQGVLKGEGGHLLFQPCQEQRRFVVNDSGNTGVLQEASAQASKPGTIFVDLLGSFSASKSGGNDGQLNLQQVYRIERSTNACEDPNFKRLTLRASGHAPNWNLKVSGMGMVLEREGQQPLALPYLEEQLPDGRFNLTSEANDQRIELWVAPQRCVDSVTGSVQHLSAELRVNGQTQRGCAYYGGSRNE
ncbi:COG3650 family protein [Pseudomonas akapageensis]|uniref:COG3650 family protein n=1 Tax=Pseudomonas akapageensis TaxID=2609961 RepID=UPI00140C91A7|nr:hypothetical protein [Pseudomonas akapageensis]